MKQKTLLFFFLLLSPLMARAYDFIVDGIAYNYISGARQVEVAEKSYWGIVYIPATVTYNGITYSVTAIEDEAFAYNEELTSVTIGNNVTSIGEHAFENCKGMKSITIGNSVTSIGDFAFINCTGITSVNITDLEAWCNISFGLGAHPLMFAEQKHLFLNGKEIKNLVIPNSVTEIGDAFIYCSSLKSITIPNSVTEIGNGAFYECSGLTSIEIPNSVTSIGSNAFYGCSGLTSATIGSGVTSIGQWAFKNCSNLQNVYCYAKNVPTTDSRAFDDYNMSNVTLHVPDMSISAYETANPWKYFGSIVAIEGSEPEPEPTPVPLKICATPTITFVDGELQFDCETEGVEYSYIITGPAVIGNGNKISLPTTYHVSVHAEKEGYSPSMTAMKEINVGGAGGIRGDVNLDGTVGMPDAMFIVNYVLNGKFPEEEEPMTYYYYAGWTLPTESNIETIINETLPENSGSSTLNNCGKKTTSKSSMDFSSNTLYNVNGRDYYYVLVPEGQTIVDPENVDVTENYTSQGTITIGNQSHVIYKSNMTTRYINDITIY